MKINLKKQRGVTIVELLVYIGLLSVFLIVLMDVFVAILNARLESQSTSSLSQDTRYILSRLTYDLTNADTISTPTAFGTSSTSLVFTSSGSTFTYSVDGSGNLTITNGGSTMKLNGADTTITGISFTKVGNASIADSKPTIKVTYTIRSNVIEKSGQQEQTINTTLGTR